MHRTQKKRFSFSRSLAYSICWDRLSLSFTASFFTLSQFHKRFNLFIIRSTASLVGTEGGDSWDWDCALLVPSKTIAITRPTELICRNAFMTNILLARGSSHARGKVDTVKVVSLNRCRPCTVIK